MWCRDAASDGVRSDELPHRAEQAVGLAGVVHGGSVLFRLRLPRNVVRGTAGGGGGRRRDERRAAIGAREGQLRGGVPIAPRRRPSLGRPPPSTRQRRHPRPPLRCAPLADARRSSAAATGAATTPTDAIAAVIVEPMRFTDSSRRSSPGLDLRVARPLREGSDARVKPAGALGDVRALEGRMLAGSEDARARRTASAERTRSPRRCGRPLGSSG